MASTRRSYGKEEFARRGDAIYDKQIRRHLTADEGGKFVVIDIETGAYAIGLDEIQACDQPRAQIRDAQIWLKQIGLPYLHRFGRQESRGKPLHESCREASP